VTTVGRVIEELVPPGGEALRQIRPGEKVTAVNGQPVTSWDDVQNGIACDQAAEGIVTGTFRAPSGPDPANGLKKM